MWFFGNFFGNFLDGFWKFFWTFFGQIFRQFLFWWILFWWILFWCISFWWLFGCFFLKNMYLADDFILTWTLFKEVSNQQTLWLELPWFSFETRLHNIQMEIPILEQGASKLWTAEHRAWNSVRNFPLESTTPSTRNWPTRLLFYFCAKPVFFFIPKILLFLTRVHFNWWLIDPLLTASWLNMVLETAFRCWLLE